MATLVLSANRSADLRSGANLAMYLNSPAPTKKSQSVKSLTQTGPLLRLFALAAGALPLALGLSAAAALAPKPNIIVTRSLTNETQSVSSQERLSFYRLRKP